jgi:hypothetical protein
MIGDVIAMLPEQGRWRPFQKGGRAILPAVGPARARRQLTPSRSCWRARAEGLTRRAVELALAGDPMALRLCVERILPVCARTRR